MENYCLLNPAWIDGSINSVNGLLIKLITGPSERFVNSDLVVSTCYIIILVDMRGRLRALRQVKPAPPPSALTNLLSINCLFSNGASLGCKTHPLNVPQLLLSPPTGFPTLPTEPPSLCERLPADAAAPLGKQTSLPDSLKHMCPHRCRCAAPAPQGARGGVHMEEHFSRAETHLHQRLPVLSSLLLSDVEETPALVPLIEFLRLSPGRLV